MMAKNTVTLLERGVFLPAKDYDTGKNHIIPHLKRLLILAKKNMFEPGIIEEADDFLLFLNEDEENKPTSFQYRLKLENGKFINIRDHRKPVINLAFAAFSDSDPNYEKTIVFSISTPSVYHKKMRKLHTGEESEFYELYTFSEKDEIELKKLILQIKENEPTLKLRRAPPVKKVERDETSIQEIMAGKTKAPIAISLMAPANAAIEILAQKNEVSTDENPPTEASFFAQTEPVEKQVTSKEKTAPKKANSRKVPA